MELKFSDDGVEYWAQEYLRAEKRRVALQRDYSLTQRTRKIRRRKYLTLEDLKKVAYWKSPRIIRHINQNDDAYVREITKFALSATEERSRIEALTLLKGVRFRVASVILHFFHSDRYPIIDFRALWSLGERAPKQDSFRYWQFYVKCSRRIADRCSADMRTLDRALWQYSKENQ